MTLAALTAWLWPTIQRVVGSDTYQLSRFEAAAIVAVTFSVIGLLVYFVAEDKRLWDLLQLLGTLAIPVVIAFGTLWFTTQQNEQGCAHKVL
jgi:heme/copper-type cytochrome/quinol oxidase subunit 4